ncbi:hypothetical protein SEVIR_7G087900v4 [Setaria viridis]|uniref:Pollen-specific protein C13 n=1 Tax=Setaria viridis TaxID=4556 RepID=A0A4U6U213_SETVI|nr:pollen-specific protein C13-like [Setaria viridis]TKW04107.1 hypothetical protein SEVIR_7G087900v2 [Setaria viridis]
MASLRILPAVTVAVLFYVVVAVATDAPDFVIQGRVYCDTCRAGFQTNVTEYIKGAKVRLECKHFGTGAVERAIDGVTDESGFYTIKLKGGHEEDICEVILVESPRKDCAEVPAHSDRASVLLAKDAGISDDMRFPNPLGYFKDVPLPVCGAVLKEYLLDDQDE